MRRLEYLHYIKTLHTYIILLLHLFVNSGSNDTQLLTGTKGDVAF